MRGDTFAPNPLVRLSHPLSSFSALIKFSNMNPGAQVELFSQARVSVMQEGQ